MRVCYIGNFVPAHSTENAVLRAFQTLGHDVVTVQEQDFLTLMDRAARHRIDLLGYVFGADLVVHTMTQGYFPRGESIPALWKECERRGVVTASIHLDRFYGLASPKRRGPMRFDLPRLHPMFRVQHVFTADGAHDDDFRRDGVNHHWLPPGVPHDEAIDVGVDALIPAGRPNISNLYDLLGREVSQQVRDGHYLVGFAGSDQYHDEWPHRPQLIAWLRARYKDRFLHIGGTSTPRITGLALNRVLASVPVWVGDSCLTSWDDRYWSDRVPETWGRGGFLIHPGVAALDDHYGALHPGNGWECGDWKALGYVLDDWLGWPLTRAVKQRSMALFTREHDTYVQRVEAMLDRMGLHDAAPR